MTPPPDDPHTIVTLGEILKEVRSLKETLGHMPEKVTDHESRLRALERKVWGIGGAAALSGAVLSEIFSKFLGA